ncbi:phosphotransferase [Glycomyces salinus]|uniref:phosphotransferase n=1 Tax=Glycomyces salinus TaxID=980294 RepID=UPI0018EBD0DE|nr:phosphotransferase [Glycomyces salinus]
MIIAPGWANLVSRWADHPAAVSNIHTNGSITTATFTAGSRKYFCKAAPTDHIEAVQALRVEATASTIHRQASAPFHGLLEGHDWSVLLFDHIDGEHPHFYPPESGLALSERIANLIKAPSGEASTSALPPITERIDSAPDWSTLVDDHPGLVASTAKEFLIGGQRERMRRLDGAHVAHTDIHRGNILVNGQELTIVDWGWAARAAPWFDQALLGVQLIAAGASTTRVTHCLHTRHIGHPCSADELAAFAVEMGRYWIGRLITDPAERYLWTLIKTAGCLALSLGVPEFLTLEQEVQPKLGQLG